MRLVRLERHVLQRALDRVALAGVLLALRIGHAVADRRHHLRRRAPGDLRHDRGGVDLDHPVPVRARVGAQRLPVAHRRFPLQPGGRIRTALDVGDRRLVDADQPGARAGLDRHVADRHPAFHRERADRRAGELDRVAGAAGRADRADDRQGDVLGRAAARQPALDLDQHVLRLARQQRLRRQHVLDLAGADAVRQRAERAVGRGVRIAADDRHAGQRRALLRADHVDDALAQVVHLELGDAVAGRSWRRACRPGAARSGRRCRASGRSSARCGRSPRGWRRRARPCARPARCRRRPAGWSPRARGGGRCRAARCRRPRCGRRARPRACRRGFGSSPAILGAVHKRGARRRARLVERALRRAGAIALTGARSRRCRAGAAGRSCTPGRRSSR